MICRTFFTIIICCLSIMEISAKDSNKPDVVFIIIDDLNDWIGVMEGHPQSKTPNLDALAKGGVLFTNAHCNAPQCLSLIHI